MKLLALAFACATPFLAGLATPPATRSHDTVVTQDPVKKQTARHATVMFVRHAEALPRTQGNQNPALAKDGVARAKRWATALRAAGVTKIYATELIRTQLTAAPLAKALGLEVQRYSARKSVAFANDTLRNLKNGEVVVVAGHSNTVPHMVKALGGQLEDLDKRGFLQETEHDRLIVQHLSGNDGKPMGAVQTLDLRVE